MQFEKSNGQKFKQLKFEKMKKLGKLEINPEKLMKNEELLILRGGYLSTFYHCDCEFGPNPPGMIHGGHVILIRLNWN